MARRKKIYAQKGPQKRDPSTIHIALYVRVSTDAQAEEGYSIEAQMERLEGHCKSKGITSFEFYVDRGETGANIDRPEMQRMISDITNRKINAVAVYKLDRLSRSQKDTIYLIEDVFAPHEVTFVSIEDNVDTSTKMGVFMINLLSVFAQLERETIRDRTRMGMLKRIASGLWPGGDRTPLGYTYNKETGTLEQNEDAQLVLAMRDLLFQGYSPDAISKMLGFKYDTTVRNALTRRANVGIIEYCGEEYEGKHEPIYSIEDYNKIMHILETRSKPGLRGDGHLLSGLLECARCGAKMRYQKWGKAGYKIYCYSQQKSKRYLIKDPSCDNDKVDAEEVENAVLNSLFSYRKEEYANDEGKDEQPSAITLIEEQYDAASRKLKRLYNLYAEGDDALEEVIDEQKKLLSTLKRKMEIEKAYLEGLPNNRPENTIDLDDAKSTWPQMSHRERRAVILEYISRIRIDGHSLDIQFKF